MEMVRLPLVLSPGLVFSFRALGSGFRVQGFGFRVWGSRYSRNQSGIRVSGFGFRISWFGSCSSDFGFRVWESRGDVVRERLECTLEVLTRVRPGGGGVGGGSVRLRVRVEIYEFKV